MSYFTVDVLTALVILGVVLSAGIIVAVFLRKQQQKSDGADVHHTHTSGCCKEHSSKDQNKSA